MSEALRWSFVLIGLAIAAAGALGVLLPPGQRWAVFLTLAAGAGIGVVGLSLGAPGPDEIRTTPAKAELVFLWSSIAGFVTVAIGLVVVWVRARPRVPEMPGSETGADPAPAA